MDHIMSVLTNIDNKNHIFIKIISDYYININLYIYISVNIIIIKYHKYMYVS